MLSGSPSALSLQAMVLLLCRTKFFALHIARNALHMSAQRVGIESP